jgi:hypothetical protein
VLEVGNRKDAKNEDPGVARKRKGDLTLTHDAGDQRNELSRREASSSSFHHNV